MIRAFIFDIGNVLLRFDFSLVYKRLAPLCDGELPSDIEPRVDAIKVIYEAGEISRDEFLKKVFDLLRFRGTEAQFVAAWEDIFEENAPMVSLVESLHGRYPLYLLSNTSDIHAEFILRRYPFFGRFSDGVYSYRVRCAKPDRAIYDLAARQFGVAPGETIFIDDLPANIASAREAGFNAIQYDFRRHDAFLGELDRLGLIAHGPLAS